MCPDAFKASRMGGYLENMKPYQIHIEPLCDSLATNMRLRGGDTALLVGCPDCNSCHTSNNPHPRIYHY